MDQEEYSFIKEQVKEKPIQQKKMWNKLGQLVGSGAVIGLVACLVFYGLAPWMQSRFQGNDSVIIQEDIPDQETEENGEDTQVEAVLSDLTAENYQQMMSSVNDVISDVNRSLVTVTGTGLEKDGEVKESLTHSVSGVLIAETNANLFFLFPSRDMKGYSDYDASFGVGNRCKGTIRALDGNTGLAVLQVSKLEMETAIKGYYKVATLGNSYAVEKGQPLIAVGNLFGVENSTAMGLLSAKGVEAKIKDANISLLVSDIAGQDEADGVFVNLRGEVLGVILPEQGLANSNVLTAVSISQVKDIIEMLSNGTAIPYLGITGTTLDASTAEKEGLEEGVYVTSVAMDSPAMEAGIQTGDIITSFNGKNVMTMDALHDALLETRPGDEVGIKGKRPSPEGLTDVRCKVLIGSLE